MTFRGNRDITDEGYYRLVNAVRHAAAAGDLDDEGVRWTYDLALGRQQ